ncbi:hypothetical protein GOQ30_12490 [Flavobacterium sp. TP390]|uniref:Uncharacterized protein n=1 Tax=Flavobacterium profundi TaxID=1774945 RepID=A0A6I4ISY8_9FLAO|nr:hypothetical protein [Flavobacterium profundi]MVO09981.1 hypothetical protein [Flavobacterium profundi]
MNEELENQFYFLRNFIVEGFENYKIDKILICENLKDKSVIFVYLKIYEKNWQKYFLDSGAGFWEDTETINYLDLENIEDDEDFILKDYSNKFNIKNKEISKIYCEPNEENCQIIIQLKNSEKILLRCRNSKIFDSECEIVFE